MLGPAHSRAPSLSCGFSAMGCFVNVPQGGLVMGVEEQVPQQELGFDSLVCLSVSSIANPGKTCLEVSVSLFTVLL